MPAEVAVVVGNHQGESVLRDCLESLAAQTRRPDEVIVVDAASSDRSREIAEEFGAQFIPAPNRGLGFLYNRGAEATNVPYLLLLNNDVALGERCLELLAAELDADPSRFAADPQQLGWDGETLVHARVTMRRGPLLRELLPGFRLDQRIGASQVVPTVFANGGAMMVRRDRLLALGGFDESFFLDFEDIDLCWRAWLRGWASVYVPDAILRHRVGAVTTTAVLPRRLISSHHNLMRFALKCLPIAAAARVVAAELVRLPRYPRLVAPAFAGVIRELPEIRRQRRVAGPKARHLDWVLAGMP